MLRKILASAIITIFLLLFTGCAAKKQLTLTAADNGTRVEVKSGGEITLTLDGNPSTGYTWEAKDLDKAMFEQLGDPVFISSNPGQVGSGGTLTITFKSLKAGSSTLTLIYHRPWEVGVDPLDTFSVTVTVK
jgi:inhibitor of cysteine peptidase